MKTYLVILSLVLGTSLFAQTEKSYKAVVASTVSADKAWTLITDMSKWKLWDDGVVDARFEGPLKEKAVGRVIKADGTVVEYKIIALEDAKTYTFKHKLSSGVIFTKRIVTPSENGSSISEEVWFKGISGKTFEKYCGADYGSKIESNLNTFKAILED
ncbi:MAG: SRPBCC family protein [Saonia sp.]